MKPNIGLLNAFVRLTCGFTFLAWATARMVKRPHRDSYPMIIVLSAMKIAEGITRFCPVTEFLTEYIKRINTEEREQQIKTSPYEREY